MPYDVDDSDLTEEEKLELKKQAAKKLSQPEENSKQQQTFKSIRDAFRKK